MSSPMPSLSWPVPEAPLPIAPLRPVLERLASLALTHQRDVAPIPGLAEGEGEFTADPPPVLEQILDEFGGIRVGDRDHLSLVVDERTDVGPYTLLGAPTSFYPLHEGEDVAVILAILPDGTAGAVYGIGEDLALRLVATDLGAYLERFADALASALDRLDALEHEADLAARRGTGGGAGSGAASGAGAVSGAGSGAGASDGVDLDSDESRAEELERLLVENLYATVLGIGEDDEEGDADEDVDAGEDLVETGVVAGAEAGEDLVEVPVVPLADFLSASAGSVDLPEGTIGVADLREAPVDAFTSVIDAELPGDPLDWHVEWREGGRVVAIVAG
ncbi:hypothetical protein ACXET9_11455 [Brachybacterium sp. DNPG3]